MSSVQWVRLWFCSWRTGHYGPYHPPPSTPLHHLCTKPKLLPKLATCQPHECPPLSPNLGGLDAPKLIDLMYLDFASEVDEEECTLDL